MEYSEMGLKMLLKYEIDKAQVITHPDTLNTFAAYQVILSDGIEIWVNAHNGHIISAGRTINRL